MTGSVNSFFQALPKDELQQYINKNGKEAVVFATYVIRTGMALREKAGVPISQVRACPYQYRD